MRPSAWSCATIAIPGVLNDERIGQILQSLLQDFGASRIEHWSQQDWQAFTLHFIVAFMSAWGARDRASQSTLQLAVRPRDRAMAAGASDPDLLAHDVFEFVFPLRSWIKALRVGRCQIATQVSITRSCIFSHVPSVLSTRWLRRLESLVTEEATLELTPQASIERSLADLGISHEATMFHPADLCWRYRLGGMMLQMETNAAWTIRPAPSGTLEQFLAVRLMLDRAALAEVATPLVGERKCGSEYVQALDALPTQRSQRHSAAQRAFALSKSVNCSGSRQPIFAAG